MAIEHNTITDPELHEPKGVAAAAAGTVYVADGAGSGAWLIQIPQETVQVSSATDLPAAVAGVRTLAANTTYQISGTVSIGSDRLVLSDNTMIKGNNPFVDIVTTTNAGNMITSNDNCIFEDIGFTCASGRWLEFDGSGTKLIVGTRVVVHDCDTAGNIANPGVLVFDTCQVTDATTRGFLVTGTGDFFKISNGRYTVTTGTILDFGTAVLDRIYIGQALFNNPSGQTGIAIAASSANLAPTDGVGYIIDNFFLTPANASSGYTLGDSGWVVRGNRGIQNSTSSAQGSIEGSALNTTFSATGSGNEVLVNFGAAFVADIENGFTISTAGRFTHNGRIPTTFLVNSSIFCVAGGGATRKYTFFIAKNGTIIDSSLSVVEVDGTNPKSSNIQSVVSLDTSDFIELYVRADTATTNLNVDTTSITVTQLGT